MQAEDDRAALLINSHAAAVSKIHAESKNSLSASEIRVEELETRVKKLTSELQTVQDNARTKEETLQQTYIDQLKDNEKTMSSQKDTISELEKKFADITTLNTELVQEKAAKEAAEKHSKDLTKELESAISMKDEAVKKLGMLADEVAAAKSTKDTATKEYEALFSEHEAAKVQNAKKVGSLSAELAAAKAEKEAALDAASKDSEAKLQEARQEKEAAVSATLEKTSNEKAEGEKALKDIQEKLTATESVLKKKEAALEKFGKEIEILESQIPILEEKVALAESLAKEKEAAIDNQQKQSDAKLKVLEAELAEAKIAKEPTAGGADRADAEVSTGTEDGSPPPETADRDGEKRSVVAIVRHPFSSSWTSCGHTFVLPNYVTLGNSVEVEC
jgi:DNA repair exonuclease SbcCD ATPase subunit